jgi:hypothetical protein
MRMGSIFQIRPGSVFASLALGACWLLAQTPNNQNASSAQGATGKYDGKWQGETSERFPIVIYVINNEIRSVVLTLVVSCPGHIGNQRRVFTSDPKVKIANASFSIASEDDTQCGKYRGLFTGKFATGGKMSGTGQLKPPGDSAGKTIIITFNAAPETSAASKQK